MYTQARLMPVLFTLAVTSFSACSRDNGPEDRGEPSLPPTSSGWDLMWYDHFEDGVIDTARWNVLVRENSYNNELQYYLADEVYIEDGQLVLRSRKRSYGTKQYTSGQVHTQHKFTQTYGRFEVRARLPRGQGIWPAHWMLPEDGSWPPEIDIMEFLGHDRNTIHMTSHWGVHADGSHPSNHGSYQSGADFSAALHTYAVEWGADSLRWYIDGVLRHVAVEGVPQKPFFLILNTAVGGDWPGNPDQTTVFPQYHVIDYVAVFTRTGG